MSCHIKGFQIERRQSARSWLSSVFFKTAPSPMRIGRLYLYTSFFNSPVTRHARSYHFYPDVPYFQEFCR